MAEIKGWRGFFDAVERMREMQKIYRRTRTPSSHASAKMCEAEVDAVIKARRREWDAAACRELPGLQHGKKTKNAEKGRQEDADEGDDG